MGFVIDLHKYKRWCILLANHMRFMSHMIPVKILTKTNISPLLDMRKPRQKHALSMNEMFTNDVNKQRRSNRINFVVLLIIVCVILGLAGYGAWMLMQNGGIRLP
jgi:hypothetical protein